MINRKQLLALIAFVLFGALIIWIGREDSSQKAKSDHETLLKNESSDVNSNPAPQTPKSVDTAFPPAPGREVFLSRCTACHSLQFTMMQPNLSKEGWAKEINKMVVTYHADISEPEAKQIAEYLGKVKGL